MAFTQISRADELESLFEQSNDESVILFKHSLTCPISHAAYEEMSRLDRDTVNLIVVQDARSVSNEIAQRTGIKHESPQILILRGGEVAFHSSHYDITKAAVLRALEDVRS